MAESRYEPPPTPPFPYADHTPRRRRCSPRDASNRRSSLRTPTPAPPITGPHFPPPCRCLPSPSTLPSLAPLPPLATLPRTGTAPIAGPAPAAGTSCPPQQQEVRDAATGGKFGDGRRGRWHGVRPREETTMASGAATGAGPVGVGCCGWKRGRRRGVRPQEEGATARGVAAGEGDYSAGCGRRRRARRCGGAAAGGGVGGVGRGRRRRGRRRRGMWSLPRWSHLPVHEIGAGRAVSSAWERRRNG